MTVRTIALFSRKPGMSFAEFDEYWRETHGALAANVPGIVQYVQRHIVPVDGQNEPDNEYGVDGIAVLDYESAEAMEAAWATPEGQKAMEDVPNFLGKFSFVTLEDHIVISQS